MFPITALVLLIFIPLFSYYPEVYAVVLPFPKMSKMTSIIKAFISYIQCFIAYCLKNVNIIIWMKQKSTCVYILPLNGVTKHIKHLNEGSNK